MLFFFMAVFSVLFATLIWTVEDGEFDPYRRQFVREDGTESPFESIPAATWWTIITMTTVGYGDHYPVTAWGQIVAVLTMVVALVVLSLPITIIGANFDEEYAELRRSKQEEKKKLTEAQRTVGGGIKEGDSKEGKVGRRREDPVKEIQKLVVQAHADIIRDVEDLMKKQDIELREKIRPILEQCAQAE